MLINMIMAEMNSTRASMHNPTILLEHCESNDQLVVQNEQDQNSGVYFEPKEVYKDNKCSGDVDNLLENGELTSPSKLAASSGGGEEPTTVEEVNEDPCETELEKLLRKRVQPIQELVYSEQAYVRRLTFVKERYMPVLEEANSDVPDDLANKWRILWGNWLQLDAWHSTFVEKLDRLATEDPDEIPKLFIDSRARLRSIYSKYCENHRKAALIVEQYRDYFDDVRQRVGDKEDVVSHLMQPVQRIMRYQLPMGEIVKLTDRADLPSKFQWRKALDIMKEIPKDSQLILEAARIDGFPGVITSLGNMRIRGELLVATTTKSEMHRDSFAPVELRFLERRLFLFDQMLLITEEIKAKKKDPFAQSSYLFKNAINVNKMKFESHWSFADDDDDYTLCFAIFDESPGKEGVYVVNPSAVDQREQWVIHLRDIQMMQQEFLLALQDPRRFAAGGGSDKEAGTSGEPSLTSKGKSTLATERCNSEGNWGKKKKHRLPNLSKKPAKQLSSDLSPSKQLTVTSCSSIPVGQHKGGGGSHQHQSCRTDQKRSSSMERLPVVSRATMGSRKNSAASATDATRGDSASGQVKQRSWSNFSLRLRRSKRDFRKSSSQSKDDQHHVTASTTSGSGGGTTSTKKKSIFGWFGKNKQKNVDSEC